MIYPACVVGFGAYEWETHIFLYREEKGDLGQ